MSLRPPFVLILSALSSVVSGSLIPETIFNLGATLFHHQLPESAQKVPDNFIVSPLGLSVGLGLIESASTGDLKQVILRDLFHWPHDAAAFQSNLTAVQKVWRSAYNRNTSETVGQDRVLDDVTVSLQSALFKREDLELSPDFRRRAEQDYHSEIIRLNGSLSASDRQSVVNEWARNATRDLIKSFPVPDHFQMLLANTVYFQGDWLEPFSSQYTRKGVFRPTGDANTFLHNVQYLQGQLEELPYYEDGHMQMIRLSYVVGDPSKSDVAMFVMLPQRDRLLKDQIHLLNFTTFRGIIKQRMANHTVNVKLPKVTLQHRINVKKVMEEFKEKKGRRWVRSAAAETLALPASGMGQPKSLLTEFFQDTVLEVNEKGTRAASLTGGTINYDGLKKTFRCDRPYLMVIYDCAHDTVLFWAAIYSPSGGN